MTNSLSDEVPCSTHPDAPHGFNRDASHSLDRYVCDCEGWVPPVSDDAVIVPREVVLFLTGEGALDGWFFEEQRPDQHIVGKYWWRKSLHTLLGGGHDPAL